MQRYKTQPDKISVVGGNVVYLLYPIFNRNIYEYTCYVPYGNDISVALDGMHEEMRVTQTQTPIEIKITSESRNKGLATQTHTYQIHTDWRTGSKSIFVPRRLPYSGGRYFRSIYSRKQHGNPVLQQFHQQFSGLVPGQE